MSKLNIKIFSSLFLSFLIVILINGSFIKYQKDLTPADFYQNIKKSAEKISQVVVFKISSFKIKKLFSLSKKPENFYYQNENYPQESFFTLPTREFFPTQTPIRITNFPSSKQYLSITPLITFLPTKFNYPSPTKKITPTDKIKPTATPTPAPIVSDQRPGKTLIEIFYEVQKRQCVPAALLMAFKTKETGERFKKGDVSLYNTYGWWKNNDPCYGFGYYAQTGIIPPDSFNANGICSEPIGDQSYDQKIMGLLQISEQEQEGAYKYLKNVFVKNYDRRVFFDNAMIFAVITKNRLGNPPKDCVNWPDEAVKIAAAKHNGGSAETCSYYYSQNGVSGDYCKEILELYKKYKKEM